MQVKIYHDFSMRDQIMTVSVFDLFSIGIGPSSSHTVGPMKAARAFVHGLNEDQLLAQTQRVRIELFGSLAFTGRGHGSDFAILLGLEGQAPDTVNPDTIRPRSMEIIQEHIIDLCGAHLVAFDYESDFIFNFKDSLPMHTNAMRFTAYNQQQEEMRSQVFYSIGGGFIIDELQATHSKTPYDVPVPYPFANTRELLMHCENNNCFIKDIVMANEASLRSAEETRTRLMHIAKIMGECIDKGCHSPGVLPGGLNIKRRAPDMLKKIAQKNTPKTHEHTDSMAWLNLYAIAVNEENAAGSRIVTAPTNGAAGVIPAVLTYYLNFYPQAQPEDAIDFLLTAGAIAVLYKKGASISGAEVGCQGEVGVACSMAAGALTAVLGGTIYQVENAAEIAMEHHLGMTCDPMNGLVQIPCIERNAMGAVKAVNAARLALLGDGTHHVTLDKVIATMKQTGKDMMSIYKETSLGGLAANIPEC